MQDQPPDVPVGPIVRVLEAEAALHPEPSVRAAPQPHADAMDGLVEQLHPGGPAGFAAQGLRTLGVVPDIGILELALDFLQALDPGVVVKETPSAHPADR